MEDKFRFNTLGELIIKPSEEALVVKKASQNAPKYTCETILPFDEAFSSDAPADCVLQYTQYKGQTFEWVLLNDLSFIFYLARDLYDKKFESLKSDKDRTLHSLVSWALSFPSVQRSYQRHKSPRDLDARGSKILSFGPHSGMSYAELYESTQPEHIRYIEKLLGTKIRLKNSTLAQYQTYIKDRNSRKSENSFHS